jgi:DNA invertase Pin-like site-specific DNA recombinase
MSQRSNHAPFVRAAKYVRMSTEHQQYSTENQSEAIEKYAATRGMEIVKSYVDHGKSGLTLTGRLALLELLKDVESGKANFDVVLVYDVSRWGRFQDADESAYYEYVCKRANVIVHYCAEQFSNDGSFSSAVLKTIKRSMAGEYSRELSVKVFAGQCRLIELGYRQGGHAGFGLRRQLVDRENQPKSLLQFGEQKSIQTDRVVLVPGPEDEVALVRDMYDLFTLERRSEREIADLLNDRGIATELGRAWTRGTVHQILTNPKYVGTNVYNRRSFKLKKKRVNNPPEMWIRRDRAFPQIISTEQFVETQQIIEARHRHMNDAEMLVRLKGLWEKQGALSGVLIDEDDDMPSSGVYRRRFQSLIRAYTLIGYTPQRDYAFLEVNQLVREKSRDLCDSIVARLHENGASVETNALNGLLLVNHEFSASLVLARCRETLTGSHRWFIRLEASLLPDITIAARLAPGNRDVLDFYLLPNLDRLSEKLSLASENPYNLDVYRFENLNFFMSLGRRVVIREAA